MSHKSTRLGDLLIEQRAISAAQLRQAIDLQQARLGHSTTEAEVTSIKNCELGEILIELGFIDRRQLKSSLSWQRNLRRATSVMVFIAPLLTAACGGGGGSSSGSTNNPNAAGAMSSQTIVSEDSSSSKAMSSETAPVNTASSVPTSSTSSKATVAVTTSSAKSSASSTTIVVALPQSSVASSVPVLSSAGASSSAPSDVVNGPVQLLWAIPKQRENGEYLDITEIGGYELRYKRKADTSYETITVADGFTDAYYFDYLNGDYQFEIATYDKNGLYSAYVAVNPY